MDADTRRPDYVARGHKKRWVCEETVWVGDIGDTPITGSTDLFDLHAGQTVDWKFVGQNSLKKYRAKGPSDTYRVQAHLYGRGWERRGCKVNAVSILFLPAQSAAWGDHFWWSEPYDEQTIWISKFEPCELSQARKPSPSGSAASTGRTAVLTAANTPTTRRHRRRKEE